MHIVPTAELAALIGPAPVLIDPTSDLARSTLPFLAHVEPDPVSVAVAAPSPAVILDPGPSPYLLLAAVCGLLAFGALIFACVASIGGPTLNHAPAKLSHRIAPHAPTHHTFFAHIP